MLRYELRKTTDGELEIATELRGKPLLSSPLLNKGTAFTQDERQALGLVGKLPFKVESLEEQLQRAYRQYGSYATPLQRNIFLSGLQDKNEILFYKLLTEHLSEMLPMIYTPTVGAAVKAFSHEFRQPRGLYLSYDLEDHIADILDNRTHPDVDVIVVTDGERVLGIGDQGVGAMDIPMAKLVVYTLCGGINPYRTLPIMLDVGTDNEDLLNNPLYLGWRHKRIRGAAYDCFIEKFMMAVKQKLPRVFLQWEDFSRDNARRLLERYRTTLCTFNDDMQGTAVVALAAVLSGVSRLKEKLAEQRIMIFGAGTAGVGIADYLSMALEREGLTKKQACQRIWLVDREGLLIAGMEDLLDFQKPYAQNTQERAATLKAAVDLAKPTILIGCSAVSQAFTEEIVRGMLKYCQQPIILPLSNPNERAEAHPQDLLDWTEARAFIASGSPFENIQWKGQPYEVAQCNNALVFPGIGLGVIASQATMVSDGMLWAACQALSEFSPTEPDSPLLPSLVLTRVVAKAVALRVAEAARSEGLSQLKQDISLEDAVEASMWQPRYLAIKAKN